jgi:hypothetical protein
MQIPDVKLFTDTDTDTDDYDEDLLLEIRAGVVYVLIRGRNAWHSTWVRHYFKDSVLYSNYQSARAGAEALRGPGNVFYISETPALLLRGEQRSIVICDSHSSVPFQDYTGDQQRVREYGSDRWVDGLHPGVSLWDAYQTFSLENEFWSVRSRNAYSLKFGEVPIGFTFVEHEGGLLSWKSYAQGGAYALGWLKYGPDHKSQTTAVDRVVDYWKTRLREVLSLVDSEFASTRASLAHYRQKTIGAVPRSIWRAERQRRIGEAQRSLKEAAQIALEASRLKLEAGQALAAARKGVETTKLAFLKLADSSAGIRKQREAAAAAQALLDEAEARFAELAERRTEAYAALEAKRSELGPASSWR